MKNSKIRRIVLLLACMVLLVSLSVGATLAYLTSTKTVENTFTVGNVNIKLDEAVVNKETGEALNPQERTETGNALVLMVPGRRIAKDPTVTVLAGSENCYVRVKVTVDVSASWPEPTDGKEDTFATWAGSFASEYILNDYTGTGKGFNADSWTADAGEIDTAARTVTYILTYKNSEGTSVVAKNTDEDTVLPAIFTDFYVPTNLDNDALAKLAGMKIKVVAEAIQSDSFDGDVDAAWTAFDGQQ